MNGPVDRKDGKQQGDEVMGIEKFLIEIRKWASEEKDIESIILVGSYARGTQKDSSDIDLCIITPEKDKFIEHSERLVKFGAITKKEIEYWGACTSIRIWYENGFEVEFGFVEPSWVNHPLDEGTHRTLSDGYQVIADKHGYFDNLEL